MGASLRIGARVEPFTTPAHPLALQAADDEWIMGERIGLLEQFVQLGIVLVSRALEPRSDERFLRFIERPEVPFELQHRLLPLFDHPDSFAVRRGVLQAPTNSLLFVPDVVAATSALRKPYLIGVAGGSNSGKTTIARRLAELTTMELSGALTATQAKAVLAELVAAGEGDPAAIEGVLDKLRDGGGMGSADSLLESDSDGDMIDIP